MKIEKTLNVNYKKYELFKQFCYERNSSPSSRIRAFLNRLTKKVISKLDVGNFNITKPIKFKVSKTIKVDGKVWEGIERKLKKESQALNIPFLIRRFIDTEIIEMKRIHKERDLYAEKIFKKDFKMED
jgi:hypothetical protein